MTARTLEAPLVQAIYPGGTKFVLEAVDPTTRAAVSGVSVTQFDLYGYEVSGSTDRLIDLEPAYTSDETAGLEG